MNLAEIGIGFGSSMFEGVSNFFRLFAFEKLGDEVGIERIRDIAKSSA